MERLLRMSATMPTATHRWTTYRNAMLLLRTRSNTVRAVQAVQRSAGDYICGRFLGAKVYLLSHPDAIRHVLHTNHQNYACGEPAWSPLRRTIGSALLFADGEGYRRQRRLVQPAFDPRRVDDYAEAILEAVSSIQQEWCRRTTPRVDMHHEMMRLTMLAIGRVLFSDDLSDQAPHLGRLISEALTAAGDAYRSPLSRLPWLLTPTQRRLTRLTREFDSALAAVIERCRAHGSGRRDVLSLLLHHHGEPAVAPGDREIRDLITVLFGAGHETTANMLTWTWYLLARHPHVERRLHAELDAVLGGRPPQPHDLMRLQYTDLVLREALRLYPPAWIIRRQPLEPDCIEGYAVPAGAALLISPFIVQRDPRWFRDPERFEPQRFEESPPDTRPRFSYFPFGGGSRQCLGQAFAEMEGRLVLAGLAQHYTPRLVGDQAVQPDWMFLRPCGGMPMYLVRRGD